MLPIFPAGSTLLTDGWIIHSEENVVLLRIHGEALKFYKASHRGKEHRLKIVPFDVRFKEIFSYEDRHTRKGMLWRASSVYQNTLESVDDDCLPDPDPVLPDVPSFSNTLLSVLSREDPIFGQQYVNGSVFRNDVDYLVFKTHTVSLEHLAFRIELFTGMDRIGLAYALPAALPDLYGKATFPIISLKNIPIGQIDIDYMLVKTLQMDRSIRDSMAVSWGRYWKKRNTLEVGHRGMGCSYTRMATARENTIYSLSEAANKGADYVEFDVQLTKDLNLDQLHLLQLEHPAERLNKTWRVTPSEEEINEEIHNPFPHLKQVLESVNPNVGFNIEVKYPMKMKDIRSDCSKIAVNYAAGNGLLGVNFHSEELLQDASPLERAEKFKLVTFVWGDDLNLIKNLEYFRELQVDGVIYDRIGEVRPRRNTFVVENESRTALPIRTPEHSRSPTPEPELFARIHTQSAPVPEPIDHSTMQHLSISKNSAFTKLNDEESSQTLCIHKSAQNYCSLCT
ncbi:glycerophosphodiester phosphodiesterase family protein [Cooperia oncophora]